MLTDTVGFHPAFAPWAGGLVPLDFGGIGEADLLLIVADTSHRYVREQIQIVQATLKEMQAERIPSLLLFNKADRPEAARQLADLQREYPEALVISALGTPGSNHAERTHGRLDEANCAPLALSMTECIYVVAERM